MKQVLIIHGGDSFSSYEAYLESLENLVIDYDRIRARTSWGQWLTSQIVDTDILTPRFPNSQNAVFEEWKIYFEKILPLLQPDVQIIGHSLGAMFLAKYLQNYPLRNPVARIVLIAGEHSNPETDAGSFVVASATEVPNSAREVHLFHSEDDPVVPFTELAKFQADMPHAHAHVFSDKKHFNESTFPELLAVLQQK